MNDLTTEHLSRTSRAFRLGPRPVDTGFDETGLSIRVLTKADDPAVVAFLDRLGQANPGVLGYHYPFYRDMLVDIGVGDPVYLGAFDGGRMVGLLPMFRRRRWPGTVFSSLPFFGPNGGVLCAPDRSADVHDRLLRTASVLLQDKDAISCSIYTPFLGDDYSAYERVFADSLIVDKFTQYTPLDTACWEARVVGSIRTAERKGVQISDEVTPERVDRLFEIYQENCLAAGVPPKPRACLDHLTSPDRLGRFTEVLFAFHKGILIAGLIVVLGPSTASYFLPCTLAAARPCHPGSLLIEHAMSRARASGRRFWNWESSPSRECGVYLFKRGWGAVESSYRIYCPVRREQAFFHCLGADGIAREYPYYFVYPFDRLNADAAARTGAANGSSGDRR